MPRLFNVDHQHAILSLDEPGVAPGESHVFTTAEIRAGLTGSWSEDDPRAGLTAEQAWKQMRDTPRGKLDKRARAAGVEDPEKLPNKQAVVDAITAAELVQDTSDDDTDDVSNETQTDPAEPGDKEESP